MQNTQTGARIRKRREALGLSREQVAGRLRALGHHITQQQIYRWEERGGEPKSGVAAGLEHVLQVAPGWLAHGEAINTALGTEGIQVLLESMKATGSERARFYRLLSSLEGASEVISEGFVVGYLLGLRTHGSRSDALNSAIMTQAVEGMLAEGRRRIAPAAPPPKRSPEADTRYQAAAAKRTHARKNKLGAQNHR